MKNNIYLLNCARGKHELVEFNAGRLNMITGHLEIYYECKHCRYYCYIIQNKEKKKKE